MTNLGNDQKLSIRKLSTTAGFLEDCEVEFHPGLTCIIGARGTCKSTLIESLRFALNADEKKLGKLTAGSRLGQLGESKEGMLTATLGPGTVRCRVLMSQRSEDIAYDVEREIGSPPRVYEEGVREFDSRPGAFNIEILSQNDLQLLADDASNELRLRLIDRPFQEEVTNSLRERGATSQKLMALSLRLRELRSSIAVLRADVQARALVAQQLKQIETDAPQPSPALETELRGFESRSSFLEDVRRVREKLRRLQQDVKRLELPALYEEILSISERAPELVGLPHALNAVTQATATVNQLLESTRAVEAVELNSFEEFAANRVEALNESYYKLRAEEQHVNEVLKQTAQLKRQLEALDKREAELREREGEIRAAEVERVDLRRTISLLDSQLYEMRSAEIESINQEHFETVLLSLTAEHAGPAYEQLVFELLQGSRIREQREVAQQIAAALPASSLVDMVEGVKSQELSLLLGRDLGQAARILSHLSDHPQLYQLEAVASSTRLDITFYDGESAKSVESLSKGQKATALLPIVLRALPYPLVIDQPEDDLDNHFIFSFLVKAVQELRSKRQIIFVTHNANIPVLGNADQMIVMRMNTPTKAAPARMGTVDDCKQEILDLLEGGAKAFMMRENRYHELLNLP